MRYSEDIDLVQITAEPIGPTIDAIRDALNWLGKCKREQAGHSAHLVFRFAPEAEPETSLKLKVEINTREHTSLYGTQGYPFKVENGWFNGAAEIVSYDKEELFGTKLRALLQRRKNRDLFDLHEGFRELSLDPGRLVATFEHYLSLEENVITRANAEQRMLVKLTKSLTEDIAPLLPPGIGFTDDDAITAFGLIWNDVLPMLKGDPWKSSEKAIEQLRERFPKLLL
jgi:predicted nucleotidyltransferase component of viral defense system